MLIYNMIKQGINKKLIMPKVIKKRSQLLKSQDISLISSNCIGGILSHDYGLPFNSPTVNLSFEALDYIKFVERLNYYLSCELTFCGTDKNQGYPICLLDDVKINFVHYHSFEECTEKWNKRLNRINFKNIVLMFTNQNGCTDELVDRFSKLTYKKVMFSDREYPHYDFICFIPKSDKEIREFENPIDKIFMFKGFTGRRRYEDYFDFIKFLEG